MGTTHEEASPRTRERLVEAISELGPVTATELAERFSLTSAAVRRHLAALHADGWIAEHVQPQTERGRGRPSKSYVLTERAHGDLSSEYDSLARMALTELHEVGGEDAVTRLAKRRVEQWESAFAQRLAERETEAGALGIEKRVEILSEVLSDLGYAGSVRPLALPVVSRTTGVGGSANRPRVRTVEAAQLCQGHCPVQGAASDHPQLCDAETEAISRMLGVPVQRLATLARGDHACTTHIPLTDGRTP
ncbi:helix-turn-helix transcriptional regulator [Dermabacteraceae bacterium P13136]